ncbi:MAG TPA: tetratricopeptide repeat protein [Hymenobacter sp.]|jgi:tetratricopeptide (TPR) repeat protein
MEHVSAHHWSERILLLLRQGRAPQAEQELRRILQADPTDALAHAWLGMCLLDQAKLEEGQAEAETAIHLAPEYDFAYYLLSLAHLRQHRQPAALIAIEHALALDPEDPNYYHTLGIIRFQRHQWQAALKAAETGLAYDPEHVDCLGLRARSLARLGRRDEAADTLGQALHHDPDDAGTHADAGWVALETGKSKQALEHFRQALRLSPTSEYAREGLVEALKMRYWVYRSFMRFAYWSSSLSDSARRGLFLGLFIFTRFFPLLLPLYLVLVFMSWFADPLFNTLLRFNTYGRHALSSTQMRQSTQFSALLGAGIVALGVGFFAKIEALDVLGLVALGLLFPLIGTWRLAVPAQRRRSFWLGIALTVVGFIAVGLTALHVGNPYDSAFLGSFLIGNVLYIWFYALR